MTAALTGQSKSPGAGAHVIVNEACKGKVDPSGPASQPQLTWEQIL